MFEAVIKIRNNDLFPYVVIRVEAKSDSPADITAAKLEALDRAHAVLGDAESAIVNGALAAATAAELDAAVAALPEPVEEQIEAAPVVADPALAQELDRIIDEVASQVPAPVLEAAVPVPDVRELTTEQIVDEVTSHPREVTE